LLTRAYRNLTQPEPKQQEPGPFAGEANLFLEALTRATIYGEYGSGESTVYVGTETTLPILSVDTSEEWVRKVSKQMDGRSSFDLRWIDVGPIGDFGTPLGYTKRDAFRHYIMSPWQRDLKPDLVLIDGRFRVACFAASLLSAQLGSAIIFDDYPYRPEYHVVEEIGGKPIVNGRQALFAVPAEFDRSAAHTMIDKFEYVWG
jgi:hypothetical protein